MSWYKKLVPSRIQMRVRRKGVVPEGMWGTCRECSGIFYRPEMERNLEVCPKCGHHMMMTARARLDKFLDEEGRDELGGDVKPRDMLNFRDRMKYKERLVTAEKHSGESDALVVYSGTIEGQPVVAAAFEFNFIGGSMGEAVGERFLIAVRHCLAEKKPLVCFTASGGARMQESLFSLFQMSRVSAALMRMSEEGLLFISVLCHPTMGGVSASLAMLGDIIIAEPGALIGFAGPRVIEQTVHQTLPEGFQRSEFLLKHGAIDMITPRAELRQQVALLIRMLVKHPAPL